MARGSNSNISTAALVLLLGLISIKAVVDKMEHVVGGDRGWSPHIYGTWPGGIPILAGDIIVFKYDPKEHNVVQVDEGSYNSCEASANATRYNSGDERIQFPQCSVFDCRSFFMCSVRDYCKQGMKVAVTTIA